MRARVCVIPLVPLLSFASLAGCSSYELAFEGRVTDASGVAMHAAPVSIRDVGLDGDPLADTDVLARATVVEEGNTDENGHFTLAHRVASGGFFCGGLGSRPGLVVAPEGTDGPAAVFTTVDLHQDSRSVIGDVRLPADVQLDADPKGLYVAAAPGPAGQRYVHVDGQLWSLDDSGALPPFALAPCPSTLACEHRVTVMWSEGGLRSRARRVILQAAAPTEINGGRGLAAGPAAVSDIVIDGVYTADAVFAADKSGALDPALVAPHQIIAVEGATGGSDSAPLPASACRRYGSGVHCVLSGSPVLRGLRFISTTATTPVARLYAR